MVQVQFLLEMDFFFNSKQGSIADNLSLSHCYDMINSLSANYDIHKYFFHCFSEKIRLDVSSESSARQRIHMKNQALFSSKGNSKKLKCHLLSFLFGALRVKTLLKRIYRGYIILNC